ncbi:MAG: PD-(D/E)XK nuclease family protein [Candidatus Methanoperedens sp.]|nr:PD-(D/E)XK nuclease family protein [Candidatus Methanoperedens sp.]
MTLSKRSRPYVIPEYSLTGDLLSYLNCGLQYRYQNKGSLPPSTPVQLWFGEFIHSVMEESYLEWRDNNKRRFPWDWNTEIREIELEIDRRLRARGLYPPPRLFCPYSPSDTKKGLCPDANHPHQLIASERIEAAINTWGQHLFPLIDDAEVKLKSIRNMPKYKKDISRSNYYGITGVIDVISSVNLQSAPTGNLILNLNSAEIGYSLT